MAEFHGKKGIVAIETAKLGDGALDINVSDWKIRRETEYARARTFDSTVTVHTERHYAGFTKDSGSFEGFMVSGTGLDFTDLDGTTATATFTSGDAQAYTGVIVMSNVEINNPVDDLGKFAADFEVEGVFSGAT